MRRTRTLDKVPFAAPDVITPPVDAPTGGWDAISPLAKMETKYAVVLENWVPRTGYVELRKGYQPWVQAVSSSPVETLMVYRPSASSETLLAASGGSIWNVTTSGSPTEVVSGLSSDRWQYINFTPALGSHYLYIVNGLDAPLYYDGTTWTIAAITGVTPGLLVNIAVHKRRIWFVEKQSTRAWYLATDAITGAANAIDLGSIMTKGGYLVAVGSWTIDGGMGPDDYAVFVTSRGEIILYKGTDPASASTWELVGVFQMAPPLGYRCLYKSGSDLWLISLQGVVPIAQALPYNPDAARSVAITSRIQNAMLQAAASGQNMFGWQLISYPAQALAILNVPITENYSQQQYVMNMITGAWCNFSGWNANCFEIFNDDLYFGDNNGNVNLAYTGVADLVSPITADMKCAFNYFGDPARLKRMTMAQPLLVTSGTITPTIAVDVDFADTSPSAPVSAITPIGAIYDTSVYDTGTYAAGNTSLTNWLSVEAQGRALALRMKVNVLPLGTDSQSVFDTGVFDTMVFDPLSSDDATLQVNAFNTVMELGANV